MSSSLPDVEIVKGVPVVRPFANRGVRYVSYEDFITALELEFERGFRMGKAARDD